MSSAITSNKVKKKIGTLILDVNSEILELQKEFKRLGDADNWSSKAEELEKAIKVKKESLEDFIERLEAKPEYIKKEGFERSLKMMRTSVTSAQIVLEF